MVRRSGTARFGLLLGCLAAAPVAAVPAGGGAEAGDWSQLTRPWPGEAGLEGFAGREIRFPTTSPFAPTDADDADKATGVGTLYLPEPLPARRRPARSVPVVILLHGASGVRYAREHVYGRQFAAMGLAAVAVDVFAARSGGSGGFVRRLIDVTETMTIADAFAALRWVARKHPAVDPRRAFVMGFSYGGMAAAYMLDRRISEKLGRGLRFAGHIAFYAPCIARFAKPRTTGAPLLMLYGTADELIDPVRCRAYLDDMRRGGSAGRLIAIKDAPHQWDGGWSRFRIGRQMHGCRLRIEPDGTVRDRNTGLVMASPLMRMTILGLCVGGPPYLIGRDDRARRISNREVGRFVRAILTGRAPFGG